MNVRPSILCPVDYSEASAGALRYASALAEHFITRLIVLSVEHPLLTTAVDLGTGVQWSLELSERELAKFVRDTLAGDAEKVAMCEYEVAVGKPAGEILRIARERSCDLTVMSSHGLTGARKLFFGSTTERVLRETTVPVLVTPPVNPGAVRVDDARQLVGCIVAPVDLSRASQQQARVAIGIAEALNVPLVLVHIVEPVTSAVLSRNYLAELDSNRRAIAEMQLDKLVAAVPGRHRPEVLTASGDPAEEAVKVARERKAGLIVIGLHGSPFLGPRMGSVSYRMLCHSPALVLALPPRIAPIADGTHGRSTQFDTMPPTPAGRRQS